MPEMLGALVHAAAREHDVDAGEEQVLRRRQGESRGRCQEGRAG